MNQQGDATLLGITALFVLTGVLLLCALELQRSFSHLEKRTLLLLCTKETKGELDRYLKFMGRSNWGIKNINRVKWVMVFFPGLQGAALNAERAKSFLVSLQNSTLILYFKKLAELKSKGCFIDPRLFKTPFELSGKGYARDSLSAAKLRNKKWDYIFVHLPYGLRLSIKTQHLEAIQPKIDYQVEESAAMSSFLSSFAL